MRIGIDAGLIAHRRGMGNYVYHLISWLSRISGSHEYVVYLCREDARAISHTTGSLTLQPLPAVPPPLWEQVMLPIAAVRDHLDVFHAPANTGPLHLPRSTALVVTIHDVMYLLPYETIPKSSSRYQQLGRLYRGLVVPRVARRALQILTDSENSKQDIVRQVKVQPAKLHVVPLAANESYRPIRDAAQLSTVLKRYGLQQRFILGLGAIDPRKNTERLIRAYAKFKMQLRAPHHLVLAGLSVKAAARLTKLTRSLGIEEHVTFTGFVPESDLVVLYNAADLFVYPSLYEGFGLPVLEAMACGTPVITSPAGSIPEVAGDAALLVDPTSAEAISQAITEVLTDKGLAQRLRRRGFTQASRFSWQRTATETLRIYETVVQR